MKNQLKVGLLLFYLHLCAFSRYRAKQDEKGLAELMECTLSF